MRVGDRPEGALLATVAAVSAAAALGAAVVLVTFAALEVPAPPGLARRSATFGAAVTAGFAAGAGCGLFFTGAAGRVWGALVRLLGSLAAGWAASAAWLFVPGVGRWLPVPLLLALAVGPSWGAIYLRGRGLSWGRALLGGVAALGAGILAAVSIALALGSGAPPPGPGPGDVRPP
jgi:hypothetical protein